jgi:hypothetical protein
VSVPFFVTREYVLPDHLRTLASRRTSCSSYFPRRSTAIVMGSSDFEPGAV